VAIITWPAQNKVPKKNILIEIEVWLRPLFSRSTIGIEIILGSQVGNIDKNTIRGRITSMISLLVRDWPKSLSKGIRMDGEWTNDLPKDLLPISNEVGNLLNIGQRGEERNSNN
jgi:hypothetical protein